MRRMTGGRNSWRDWEEGERGIGATGRMRRGGGRCREDGRKCGGGDWRSLREEGDLREVERVQWRWRRCWTVAAAAARRRRQRR